MSRFARTVAALTVVVAVAGVGQHASADERSETKPYYIGADALLTSCELGFDLDQDLFGACFDLYGNETSASIVIEDLTGLPVGGMYAFRTPSGTIARFGFFCESDDLPVPDGAADLTVYVTGPGFGTVNCIEEGSIGAGTTGEITVTFDLSGAPSPPPPHGEARDCFQAAPAAFSLAGITDDGSDLTLKVKVLLEGVSQQVGQAVFATAAESYAPIGIAMTVTSFEQVEFDGDDTQHLINQAKAHVGGTRPAGVDIVYVLTSKDVQALGQDGVAGQADCIGGVRYPEHAFAVGEVISFENLEVGPITFYRDATARTAAHEIGHLMGAHHHYANCVEDAPGDGLNGEITPCTLMFNSLDLLGPTFSTLNGAIVRGHALEYATA